MRFRKQIGLAAITLLLVFGHGWADTFSLPLTDDAFINQNLPDLNLGADENLFIHEYGPKYALVSFDAASIAGQAVNSATLTLYLNEIKNPGTIHFIAMESSWSESTVTWNSVNPGGPNPPQEDHETAVFDLATSDEGSTISVDVTGAAQRWADGTLADAGFLIFTGDYIKAYFDAKEMPGGIPATLEVDTGPPDFTGEAITLDLSNPDNCIIDEPGYYVLDRTWLLTPGDGDEPNANCNAVHIASGGVTLDLQGFSIRRGMEGGNYEPVLWIDTEGRVTLRDGKLIGIFVAIEASVASDRYGVTLINIHAGGGVLLGNRFVTVTGGSFSGSNEAPLQIGEGSRVARAAFSCTSGEGCLYAHGSSLIQDCTFDADNPYGAPAILVGGNGTIVEGNVLDGWVGILGDHNVVTRNYSNGGDPYIEVNGTGNILDGNIGPSIVFVTPGNFYGNNRVTLPGGFTGTADNVDWGGNVTF